MSKIVGIDEVGRGCWAGPLVAAAVLLRRDIDGLKDSKLLSKKRREVLAEQIKASARYGIGWVTPAEVDELGLTKAVETAMLRAIEQIPDDYDKVIIDGNINYLPGYSNVQAIIKADQTVPSVSAASIIAKVARDQYMAEQALRFPNHGFERHVGYGTAKHVSALKQFGITELHRLSYKPVKVYL